MFQVPPLQRSSLPSPTRDTVHTEFPYQTATDEIVLYSIEGNSASTAPSAALPSPSELSRLPPTQVTTPPPASMSTPMPSATSPNALRREPRRRQRDPFARGFAYHFCAAAAEADSSTHTASTDAFRTRHERVRGHRESPDAIGGRPRKK